MELPTGAVWFNLLNGEKEFITNADFNSEDEFANFIYNYLNDNDSYRDGVLSIEYTKDNETIYKEDFFKMD